MNMEGILTYVINLKHEVGRREYMENLLSSYDFLSVKFVEAVYGKDLSEQELLDAFDLPLTYKRYGRELNKGEIGCTLSHFRCYNNLIESGRNYALVLEDDITILKDIKFLPSIVSILDTNNPVVLFLSGDYWYENEIKGTATYEILSVYDAVGTYAYFINKAAAKLILKKNKKASCVADHWSLYRTQGLKMKAVYPYLIDANIGSFESTIKQTYFGEHRENMPWRFRIIAYWNAFVKKILLKQGKFVSKIRK